MGSLGSRQGARTIGTGRSEKDRFRQRTGFHIWKDSRARRADFFSETTKKIVDSIPWSGGPTMSPLARPGESIRGQYATGSIGRRGTKENASRAPYFARVTLEKIAARVVDGSDGVLLRTSVNLHSILFFESLGALPSRLADPGVMPGRERKPGSYTLTGLLARDSALEGENAQVHCLSNAIESSPKNSPSTQNGLRRRAVTKCNYFGHLRGRSLAEIRDARSIAHKCGAGAARLSRRGARVLAAPLTHPRTIAR